MAYLFIFLCTYLIMIGGSSQGLELKFVAVVFRHGDRAPETNATESYPKDPYKDEVYSPAGHGGLTNQGKMREYELGRFLRQRYNEFLGDTYIPDEVIARSTDYDRTKMSLLCVLSSLYPPRDLQKWHPYLNWQPIPFIYSPLHDDIILKAEKCPQYDVEFQRVNQIPEVLNKIHAFQPFMNNLTELSGRLVDTPAVMARIYHTLAAQSAMGLPLPNWTQPMYPFGQLYNGLILDYTIRNYDSNIRRLFGGTLFRTILETMINGTKGMTKDLKMSIYSGHETSIVSLLSSLGLYKPHVPQYSSSIIIELLHENDDEYYVKVNYYKGIPATSEELEILGCESPCPLKKFAGLLKKELPSDDLMICQPKP